MSTQPMRLIACRTGDRRHPRAPAGCSRSPVRHAIRRSEEHTSELQSRPHLVCRLLLEKKKKNKRHAESNACLHPSSPCEEEEQIREALGQWSDFSTTDRRSSLESV